MTDDAAMALMRTAIETLQYGGALGSQRKKAREIIEAGMPLLLDTVDRLSARVAELNAENEGLRTDIKSAVWSLTDSPFGTVYELPRVINNLKRWIQS